MCSCGSYPNPIAVKAKTVSFETFIEVMAEKMIEQRHGDQGGNIVFESSKNLIV